MNPAALSVEAVRAVNEKGYDAAFAECDFWKEYTERGEADKGTDTPSLAETAIDGEPSVMSSVVSENAGNPVIVSGTVGRWDGTRSGLTVYKCFEDALDTSPSRFGGDNVFADCEIQKVWDENGSLFVHGAHHAGGVTGEMRQLTDFGIEAYEVIEEVADAWVDDPFTIAGKHYDGSEQSVIEAMHDLWDNPALAQPPRYMERAFGCPVEEYVEERGIEAVNLSEMAQESREAADVLAGVTGHDDHAPDAR